MLLGNFMVRLTFAASALAISIERLTESITVTTSGGIQNLTKTESVSPYTTSASGYISSAMRFTFLMSLRPMAVTVSATSSSGISDCLLPIAPYMLFPATLNASSLALHVFFLMGSVAAA